MRNVLVIALLLAATVSFAQEKPDPRLIEIAREKQRLEEQAERGRLLIENAQLKYERLTAEEQKIRSQKTESQKSKEPSP